MREQEDYEASVALKAAEPGGTGVLDANIPREARGPQVSYPRLGKARDLLAVPPKKGEARTLTWVQVANAKDDIAVVPSLYEIEWANDGQIKAHLSHF